MPPSPAKCKTRVREAVAGAGTQGLDRAVAEVEAALVEAWQLERQGKLAPRDVPAFVEAVQSALKKIAPPPPKKVKFSDPLRKILPLAEESVRPALDVALLLIGLTQVGDFTEQNDKKRLAFELFLDDWRRMTWESAKISDWDRYGALATTEERELEGRLSRASALQILRVIQNRRTDNISSIPDLSVLACAQCGQFRGRDRIRCAHCNRTICTRCLSPTADLCLPGYAARYAELDPAARQQAAADARAILKESRLDPYTRNDAFSRALGERDIDVIFVETATFEGEESAAAHGRWKFQLLNREGATTKRALFGALARSHFRETETEAAPRLVEFFVDICMGVPVEDSLGAPSA